MKKIRRFSSGFICFIFISLLYFLAVCFMSFKYRITEEDVIKTGLPILRIETENSKLINSKEKYVDATYFIEEKSGKCEIRGRGNSTWDAKKKPYLLKFKVQDTFLDMPTARKWVLMANATDNTNLRNAFATYLAKNVWKNFKWTPDYRFVNLYINGRYEGIYQVYEKIEASPSRLNIPNLNDIFSFNGSFIMVTNSRDTKPINFSTKNGVNFSMYSPKILEKEQVDFLVKCVNKFEDILFGENFADEEKGYRKYIDVKAFIDWYLINEFTTNRDARFRDSCYLYYDSSDKKLDMGPIWDFDISCGNNSYPETSDVSGYWIKNEAVWYARLFEDPWFVEQVKNRWNEKQKELVESFDYIYNLSRKLKKASELDDKAWKFIGHYQWPHAIGWQKRRTYDDEIDYFINWIKSRRDWINEDLIKNEQQVSQNIEFLEKQ